MHFSVNVNTEVLDISPQDGAWNSHLWFDISLLDKKANEVMKIAYEEVVLTA